jgi:hypothetical protein
MTSQNCVVKVRCDGGKKHQLIAHIGFCDLHVLWLWLWAFLSICNILLEFNTVHAKKIYNSDNSVFVLEHDGTLNPVVNDACHTVPYQEESHTTSSSSFHHPFLVKCSQGWHTEPTRPQDYPHWSFVFICWRVSVVSTHLKSPLISSQDTPFPILIWHHHGKVLYVRSLVVCLGVICGLGIYFSISSYFVTDPRGSTIYIFLYVSFT